MSSSYQIRLYDTVIGESGLETYDPPNGLVSGVVTFHSIESGYDFLSAYCKETDAQINADIDELKFIEAESIRGLNVADLQGLPVNAEKITIRGLDSGTFEIELTGIPDNEYQQQFPEYIEAYEKLFTLKLGNN